MDPFGERIPEPEPEPEPVPDPVRRPRLVRQAVGYVPDRPDCYEWMTPGDLYRFLKPQYPTWNSDEVERLVETLSEEQFL